MAQIPWLKWFCICLGLLSLSAPAIGQLILEPVITLQPNVAAVSQIYSCATLSAGDGLMHTYHHFYGDNTIYRYDQQDQMTFAISPQAFDFFAISCEIDSIRALVSAASFTLKSYFIPDNGTPTNYTSTNADKVDSLKAVNFGNQRASFVSLVPEFHILPYSYYSTFNLSQLTSSTTIASDTITYLAANILVDQLTEVNVQFDSTSGTVSASALAGGFPYSFTQSLGPSKVLVDSIEVFWSPPIYQIPFRTLNGYAIIFGDESGANPMDFLDSGLVRNAHFRSTLYPEWHGALLSLHAQTAATTLFICKGRTVVAYPIIDFEPFSNSIVMSIDQLDEASFVMNQWNGTTLKTVVGRLGPSPPTSFSVPGAPTSVPTATPISFTPVDPSPPIPDIVIVTFNSSTTITTLTLTNNSVLVINNEAVIEVTNCAELAGKLKYILSQNQYNALLQNETLNIIVLLTQCANGSFDEIEVVFEGVDDSCVEFDGEPQKAPGQLTILVTTIKGNCEVIAGPDPLSTGAIIGIVVGCAAAAVLIIILALYFSPLSAKVFPYAPKNRTRQA